MKLLRFASALLLLAAAPFAGGAQQPAQAKPSPQTQAAPPSQKPFWMDDPASLPKSVARIRQGAGSLADYEVVAHWHDEQTIPLLKTQFESATDADTKSKIANVLVRLGVKDGPYWDYLGNDARNALEDPPPAPFDYAADGTILPTPPRSLADWAARHHLSAIDAAQRAMLGAPGAIYEIANSGDTRAIPHLRRALQAQNIFMQIAAAQGLAALQDTASIPAIILACQHAPKQAVALLAQSLVYFNDPAAQQAVDLYVPEETAKELRAAVARGATPFNSAPHPANAQPR